MSNASDQPEAASDKRRAQARERQRRRGDLNRHYMEEEALRALDAGTLKRQEVDLSSQSQNELRFIVDRLGSDADTVLNLAIGLADSLVKEGRTNPSTIEKTLDDRAVLTSTTFTPTPNTIQAILRANNRDARSIYARAGLTLLSKGLQHSSSHHREILSTSSKRVR